jgi:hypothetical protein
LLESIISSNSKLESLTAASMASAGALKTNVKGASDELAVQDLYRYSGLYLAHWRNQQFLACGC